jgi:F420-non-reducing hydrogenase iron-sulfur subunit
LCDGLGREWFEWINGRFWVVTENGIEIAAYCCEHCAYAAADLAGNLRMQYPPTIKIILIPCTGRVEKLMLLRAFEEGIDGILVAG